MTTVIVPDPDNERGVRAVDQETGRVIAAGHLVLGELGQVGDQVVAPVTFVGEHGALPYGTQTEGEPS